MTAGADPRPVERQGVPDRTTSTQTASNEAASGRQTEIGQAASGQPLAVAAVRLPHGRDLPLPAYATAGSAGLDLCAAVAADLVIAPGGRALVPTGIAIALPDGYEAQVRPRSGLALRHGVTVANSPGTVDADYRGEVQVILANFGDAPFTVVRGMRVAQMVVAPVVRVALTEGVRLPPTGRGVGGFGSTGTGED